ncbi:hypothetical protein NDU88_000827 [Pleurodeles waltl]|uniref:BEN domain-containing protein n=1 Tax=Pleurodeles waltl TaxID=8319 RepID=A0AAV7Q8E7_PLEWA|nr:hypothetical protein NDU88_000827 [Pleurodeles waltl]
MEHGARCLLTLVDWLDEGFSSIIELSAVIEPCKSYLEYVEGEEVEARCPLFRGLFRARIIAISADRRKLKRIQVQLGSSSGFSTLQHRVAKWKRRERSFYWRPRPAHPLGESWRGTKATSRGKDNRRGLEEADEDIDHVISSVFTLNREQPPGTGSKQMTVASAPQPLLEDMGRCSPLTLSPPSSPKNWSSLEDSKERLTPALIDSVDCFSDASEEPTRQIFATVERAPKDLVPPRPQGSKAVVVTSSHCRSPECEMLSRELEALRDQCAKLQAHNVMLQQQLNTAYADQNRRPHQDLNDGTSRPKAGLYDDPELPLSHGMIELVLGTGIYLYESQLTLARSSARSQTALARLLLDIFFTRDEQAKSNLSGENGLQCLNPRVVGTIVAYAISQEQYQPTSSAVIKNSLRNKLGCLRAPSRLLHSKSRLLVS